MKYKLLFKGDDLTLKNVTDSGSVLHGLECLREWITKNEKELLESQSNLRSIQKTYPLQAGTRRTSVQDNWEWGPADSVDILQITHTDQGEDTLESYKIRGVIIRPDCLEFMAIPQAPITAVLNERNLSAMEKASVGYYGRKVTLKHPLNDVMDVMGDGSKSQTETIKTFVELDSMGIFVSILNAQNQIVGNVGLENFEGELRINYWETDDVDAEPTNVITPSINYDPIYENGALISGVPD